MCLEPPAGWSTLCAQTEFTLEELHHPPAGCFFLIATQNVAALSGGSPSPGDTTSGQLQTMTTCSRRQGGRHESQQPCCNQLAPCPPVDEVTTTSTGVLSGASPGRPSSARDMTCDHSTGVRLMQLTILLNRNINYMMSAQPCVISNPLSGGSCI
jgi:hypothetical protein